MTTRVALDPDNAARGLGQLVVALLEIIRDLLERQAIRRADSGSLTEDEIERLGQALLALDERFEELRNLFAAEAGDAALSADVAGLLDLDLNELCSRSRGTSS
jgi:hypothetical protein